MNLTRDQVQRLTGDADRWTDALNAALTRWQIDTPQRVAMFLAQVAHESGGFRTLVESLHYSATRLLQVWPSRFTPTDAAAMAFDERAIAERAYGGRLGNGPEGSGDGYNYRGRGLIQLTGRDNYTRCGAALGLDLVGHPEVLEQPEYAAQSAGWFWAGRGCNELADAGDYLGITRRINGGTNGQADRETWLATVRAVLGVVREGRDQPMPAPAPGMPSNQPEEGLTMGGLAAAGLIGQLLQTVVSVFQPVARAKVEAAAGKVTDAAGAKVLADGLMGVLTQVTGLSDPVQATAAVTAPTDDGRAKLAAVEQQAVMRLDEFAGFLDRIASLEADAAKRSEESRANARAFATPESWGLRMKQVSFTQWGLGVAALAVAILTAVQMVVTHQGVPDPSLMVLLTAIVMGLVNTFRDQTGFSFGGTSDSNAAAIARDELAARRHQEDQR